MNTAVEALNLLNDGSLRVLRIRAKQKMCAHTEMICHEDFCPYAAKYSDKMARNFERHGFPTIDLTHDELAKQHVRHMVGGRSELAHDERL